MSPDRTIPSPLKVGAKTAVLRGLGKLREGLAGGSRQRIEQVGFAAVVGDVVEERAEPGAGQLCRGVGDGLHQRFEIDLGGQHAGGPVEDFEPMRLVAQDRGGLRASAGQLDIAGDTGEQLAGAERLGEIIVGPGPQAPRSAPPRPPARTAG